MEPTAKSTLSIPSFAAYVEDRKYLKNVSPKTLAWFNNAWQAFGPYLEPILTSGGRITDGLRGAVTRLLEKGVRPVSVNSYLTCARAYLNWLHSEGFLKERPRVQLLKYEQKVITTFSPEQVRRLLVFKPRRTNQSRVHVAACLMLDSGLRVSEVTGLTVSDLDFDNLLIRVKGKGNKQRLVPMSSEMRRLLYRHSLRQRGALLFGKGVDQKHAVLVVILGGVMPAAIDFFNVLNDAAALMLVRGADFLSVFDKPQRDALATLFLRLHHQEVLAAEIFWGLWLFPLAVLVYRSGFLPRFLGVWLIINGFAYLTMSFTGLLLPQYEDMVSTIAFPALLGEMAFMLWLVIKGARPQPLDAAASWPATRQLA